MKHFFGPNQNWSFGKQLLFRFLFCYFALYILNDTFFLSFFHFPFSAWVTQLQFAVWDHLVPFFGNTILGIDYDISTRPAGSGDTTYNYVMVFGIFFLAVLSTIIWTVLDRKRTNYNILALWYTTVLRYYLGIIVMGYGFVKVIKLQFRFPGLERLLKPYGDFSPMGVAWNFMGYSDIYTNFTGWGEVIGGFLLLFRKTTTLGAAITFAVMINVAFINYCYDVPVKLFSSHLLAIAALLLAFDGQRLINFFFLNKATPPLQYPPYSKNERTLKSLLILKVVLIIWVIGSNLYSALNNRTRYGNLMPEPPLYGIYEVQTYEENGDTIPPLLTDSTYWKAMIFTKFGGLSVKTCDDKFTRYGLKAVDTLTHQIDFYSFAPSSDTISLNYSVDSTNYIFSGLISQDTVRIITRKKDLNEFLLVNRGFNWVNEFPLNR